MKKINLPIVMLILFASVGVNVSAQQTSKTSGKKITVFTIGDSTMANKKAEVFPETGWCMAFPEFVDDGVEVKNRAMNGRSSKSFIAEGRWKWVLDSLKQGDYVFIQFGHNDEKNQDSTRFTDPFTTFAENLERFVRESREKGAHPILFTPIVRRKFVNGFLTDTHGNYPEATRQVAVEWNVPLVDLQYLTAGAVTALGDEPSKAIYLWTPPTEKFPKGRQDNTHLKVEGAALVAKLTTQQLMLLDNSLARHIRNK
ncbi:MAG: rhamnogalacturonan acetylesterase [Prolixibacteraceae bacterium]|jgi:lysophospholipase L1-like esterase